MRGLSLVPTFILVLSSTVAFAAPRGAVSPPPKAVAAVGTLNVRSASCKIHGACSVFSPPDTCCGTCVLVGEVAVSQSCFSHSSESTDFLLTSYLCRVTAWLPTLRQFNSLVLFERYPCWLLHHFSFYKFLFLSL